MAIDTNKRQAITAAELRRQAENQLRSEAAGRHLPPADEAMQRLIHELEVHQIELEIQNAELRQARNEMEKELENYTELYDFAPVSYITLDRKGAINAVNLTGASLLGVERSLLIGRRFMLYIAENNRQDFSAFIDSVFTSHGKETCEVVLLTKRDLPFTVLIDAVSSPSGQECRLALIDISKLKNMEVDLQNTQVKLEAKNVGLEQLNRLFVGRELRMIELKERIRELENR